jgi:hypothetical protein
MAARQLAERSGDGAVIQLYWDGSAPSGSEVFVKYEDHRRGVFYTLRAPPERALDAFYHPNAFADRAVHALIRMQRSVHAR